jgi:hypothetical protein
MLKVIRNLLVKIVNDIDVGNSNITEKEAMELTKVLQSYTDKTVKMSLKINTLGVLFLFNSIIRIARLFSLTLGHVSLQHNKLINQTI